MCPLPAPKHLSQKPKRERERETIGIISISKTREWTSTRVTTEHNSSNSEITSTTVKRSRLHFDLQTQSGFTLRPSPACSDMKKSARASRSSGSSTSCISQPNLKSRIFHTFPQQNPAQFDQDDVIQIKTLKWFRSG